MMVRPNLERVTRFGSDGRLPRAPWLLGAGSALATTGGIVVVALVAHLILARAGLVDAGSPSRLIAWVLGDGTKWPWFGRYDYCLLALLAAFLGLRLLEAVLTALLAGKANGIAAGMIGRLQRAIHAQAARLTPAPLIHRGRPLETCCLAKPLEAVRTATARWWSDVPKDVCAILVLLLACLCLDVFFTLLAILLAAIAWRMLDRLHMQVRNQVQAAEDRIGRRRETMEDRLQTACITPLFAPGIESSDGFDNERQKYNAEFQQVVAGQSQQVLAEMAIMSGAAALMLLVVGLATEVRLTDIAFLALAVVRISGPVRRLRGLWQHGLDGEEAAGRILDYLDRTPDVGQVSDAKPAPVLANALQLDNVSLADADHRLLEDVTVTLPAGTVTAVVSTEAPSAGALVALVLRHRDPTLGHVAVDGLDLREIELDTLRQRFSFVAEDGLLFTATITENIQCGRTKFTEDDLTQAADQARVLEAIELLPHGFQTVIGPDGRKLPKDQAFRIGLARALISDPTLLVIDEPHPARNGEFAIAMHPLIQAIRPTRTLVVLAKQLDTLRHADLVIVLHDGKIQAQGKHTELLKDNALYRHLNYEWFNTFRELGKSD